MNDPLEPKKNIWIRPWKSWRLFVLVLAVGTFVTVFGIGWISGIKSADSRFIATAASAAVAGAIVVAALISFIRWLFCWRNLRKGLFGLACVATLVALFYAEEDARGKWAWNHFKRQWEAKGEKLDLSSFTPAPVPDDQNFALTPIMFSTYGSIIDKTGHELVPHNTNIVSRLHLDIYRTNDYADAGTNGNWARGTLTDLAGWQQYYRTLSTNGRTHTANYEFPTSPQPQSPAEDVLLALSKYDATVEELREASKMPYSRFPLEYDKDDPAMILLPHLAKLKQGGQFLELRAIAELQAGQTEKAAADVRLSCYLTQASQSEPFLISHLVRMAMLNYELQPIYEGLAEHKWSDAQLAGMADDLAKFDFLKDYGRSMRSEAAATVKMVGYVEQTRKVSPFVGMLNPGQEHNLPALDFFCYASPSGWFRQNQIRFAEFYLRDASPVVDIEHRRVSPELAEAAQARLDEASAHFTPYHWMQYIFFTPVKRWFFEKNVSADKFAYAQESADLARVAIALERYKLAKGEYPESLNVLSPTFIQQLPRDIMGGQPLKYRRTNDNFVLYSIGWNEKDDGGVRAFTHNDAAGSEISKTGAPDPDHGDWVWSYPAK